MLLSFPRPWPYCVFSKQTHAQEQSQAGRAKSSVSTTQHIYTVFSCAI